MCGCLQGAGEDIAEPRYKYDYMHSVWKGMHSCIGSCAGVWVVDPLGTGGFTNLESASQRVQQQEQEVRICEV
jgi:hypothetical protein